MGSKHSMAGWLAIAAMVVGGFFFARSASEAMRLPLSDIEPLAISPEAYRYATLRAAAAQWAHELDRAVVGLQEQAVIERADPRQARVLVLRARSLGYQRDRAFARVRDFDRGPISMPPNAGELDRLATWLRRSAETTPEASFAAVTRLRADLEASAASPASAFASPASAATQGLVAGTAFIARR